MTVDLIIHFAELKDNISQTQVENIMPTHPTPSDLSSYFPSATFSFHTTLPILPPIATPLDLPFCSSTSEEEEEEEEGGERSEGKLEVRERSRVKGAVDQLVVYRRLWRGRDARRSGRSGMNKGRRGR